MSDKCFEIGDLQAFLDGETGPELSFEITKHAAKCQGCALTIADAEEESAQVFAMLDRELNTLVPTQRLWSSITVALAEEKKQASFWDKARGYVFTMLANPSIAAAASVLLVFGIFAGVWSIRSTVETSTAHVAVPDQAAAQSQTAPLQAQSAPLEVNLAATGPDQVLAPSAAKPFRVEETRLPADKIARLASTISYKAESRPARSERAVLTTSENYLPGEESYVRTIAGLKQSVDGRKDLAMTPSTRVSFERDLAVVNDSIKKMKEVVSKNPKNQAAKQVLYSSYQNKIDLLNSVVEREELLASMGSMQ